MIAVASQKKKKKKTLTNKKQTGLLDRRTIA
jgi:hypothetical protein